MLPSDLGFALELSKAEGWNQTEKDWRLLLDNTRNTCLVAEFNGRVIGTATAINYSNLAGWIGMVLVDKEFRRQGLGRLLVSGIIDRLQGFISVKLDATPAGEPVYKKLGFVEESVLSRMTNISFKSGNIGSIDLEPEPEPEPIKHEELEEVIKFDRAIFGSDRSYLIKTIMENYPDKAFLLKKNGRISGYILGRNGIKYNYIGPVFAHTTREAKALIVRSLKCIDNQDVAIDIHDDKKELTVWLETIGFIRQRQFVRMYLGKNPFPGRVESQYLIAGPEFG